MNAENSKVYNITRNIFWKWANCDTDMHFSLCYIQYWNKRGQIQKQTIGFLRQMSALMN